MAMNNKDQNTTMRGLSHHKPQDDIPTEVIIHYIVKDYRRMFFHCQKLENDIAEQKEEIRHLRFALQRWDARQSSDENIERIVRRLQRKIENLTEKLEKKREDNENLQKLNNRLCAEIDSMKAGRDPIIQNVTEELRQKLNEANQRIKLLAQAAVAPEKADSVFLQQCVVHAIETEDDRKWMVSATKQLEKAAMQLLSVVERLSNIEESLKDIDGCDIEKTLKSHGRVLSKLTSVISHIECFFDKIGDIKIE